MCLPVSKLHATVECQSPVREPRRSSHLLRWLSVALIAAAALALQTQTARAQTPSPTPFGQCPPSMATGQPFFWVPEIAAQNNKLRGTVMLGSEQRWIPNRIPVSAPTDQSQSQCFPQYVRYFWGLNTVLYKMNEQGVVTAQPYAPKPMDGGYPLPQPGPTLRARVGDLVQLAFINQINPSDFGDSIDRAERGRGGGCDETSAGYPGGDKYPDCFHGSSTGNIHFHGTHTNPNTTGDNVFIEVRPTLRENDRPVVTPNRVESWFNEFFTRCEQELNRSQLREWPSTWADMPKQWTDDQEVLLKRYDAQLLKDYGTGIKQLWPVNAAQIRQGAWPQYYIGSFPYCYRLPEYKLPTWPPPSPATLVMGGAGTAEAGHEGMNMGGGANTAGVDIPGGQVRMGQSPGTHWYHAHKHGSTAINVANGMTGVFVIEGQYDDDLNNWYGAGWTRTQPVMLVNQLGVSPNLMRGPGSQQDKGPDFSVNGRQKPVINMRPGEVQMWRIVNTSGRAGMYFEGPPAGFQWRQLAQDGVQFSDGNYKKRTLTNVVLASGNRADILIKAPAATCATAGGCKYNLIVKNMVDPSDLTGSRAAKPLTLLTINVTGPPVDPNSNQAKFIPSAPTYPAFLKSISDEEVTGTKKLVFGSTPPNNPPATPAMHTIDNKKFDGEVGQVVLLNTVEEWKVSNATYGPKIAHPFHIHINPFQVTEIFDPNEPLIDPRTGKAPIDPRTKKPYVDPATNQPAVKYAFRRTGLAPYQCYLDPDDPSSWRPMTWRLGGCVPTPTPPNVDNIWWDVFPIPSGYAPAKAGTDSSGKPTSTPLLNKAGNPIQVPGYFKMRSRFVDYPGFYVLHCHILAHEDRGMMTIVEVAPARTPYSHN